MIAHVRGTVVRADANTVVIDVNGVGYLVTVPVTCISSLPASGETLLHTSTIVREDELALFGFLTLEELRMFQLLTSVNGVGPKVAVNILSALTVAELVRAIRSELSTSITRVPGIGPKLAQRVILELKEKVLGWGVTSSDNLDQPVTSAPIVNDVVDALLNLGHSRADSRYAAEQALSNGKPLDLTEAILAANALLASRRMR